MHNIIYYSPQHVHVCLNPANKKSAQKGTKATVKNAQK